MKLQLITFNVNGLRSIKDYYAQSKLNNNLSFTEFLDSFEADILCFQEHKTNVASKLSHDLSFPKGYVAFYAFPRLPKKIGYSGVVTFVKENSPWLPIAWYDGFSGVNDKIKVPLHDSPRLQSQFSESELRELDSEGRCIITDHFHFILLNIYFPNDSGPERFEFRSKFYKAVQLRCIDLIKEHGKSLIILGDVNIAYHPFDHCDYAQAFKMIDFIDVKSFLNNQNESSESKETTDLLLSEFYSNPMRKWLADWIYNHPLSEECPECWRDCFRTLHPNAKEKYTCWNTQMSARGTNYGTRIDTIFTSGSLFLQENVKLEYCDIMPKVMGSDHCPVMAKFSFPDTFQEISDTVLVDCKLTKGNIPRTFGKLDSFFTVTKKRFVVEIEEEVVEVCEAEKRLLKSKISDYFQVIQPEQSDTQDSQTSTETQVTCNPSPNGASQLVSLFNRPQNIPLCPAHREPCKISKVKKAGPNRGRSFYSCARPGGAANDPEARCDFFEWVNKSSANSNKS